jgi:hypothetical protein
LLCCLLSSSSMDRLPDRHQSQQHLRVVHLPANRLTNLPASRLTSPLANLLENLPADQLENLLENHQADQLANLLENRQADPLANLPVDLQASLLDPQNQDQQDKLDQKEQAQLERDLPNCHLSIRSFQFRNRTDVFSSKLL